MSQFEEENADEYIVEGLGNGITNLEKGIEETLNKAKKIITNALSKDKNSYKLSKEDKKSFAAENFLSINQ